ncbi:MAG: ACP S-malonyltransferase [Ottowia sp.]|nr:ACP S-malonyltransferase [Ottowia sp.]
MKLAFIFPGQGSQSVGMLDGFADDPFVQSTLEEASKVLGENIAQLIAQGPADTLSLTTYTQPVMLTAGIAIYRAWCAAGGIAPAMVAGHSLGEYTALVVAQALSFADALPLVRFRAQAMQEAVPVGSGGMAAILGLDNDAVRALCRQASHSGLVEAVNFNAPAQVVIAGTKEGVAAACELAKQQGAKRAVRLPVSAPFHSSLMANAALRLRTKLQDTSCNTPVIPVINNVDVKIENDSEAIKDALIRQAAAPVMWTQTIEAMAHAGVTHIFECGPGKVLAGLTKRINPNIVSAAITDPKSLQDALALLAPYR